MPITVDDRKLYTKPLTVKITKILLPDSDVLETVCNENEKDRAGTLMSNSHLLETTHWDVFNNLCPTRAVLDRIADKWSVLIVQGLSDGTLRFAQIRRAVDGISQKVLINTLRGLERDGILTRQVHASVPPRVEYSLTELGKSLVGLVASICSWAESNIEQVQAARTLYDRTLRGKHDDEPFWCLER